MGAENDQQIEQLAAELAVTKRKLETLEREKRRVGLSFRRVPESGSQIVSLWNGDFPYLQRIPSLSYSQDERIADHGAGAVTETDGNTVLIEAENLAALAALQLTHKKRIDVIYIDPPYNTGNNDFIYNDARRSSLADIEGASPEEYEKTLDGKARTVGRDDPERHSLWLSFMEGRLFLAKQLLSETGVIFVSIDDNEQARLKLLMDEVFGEQNFIANVAWRRTDNQANLGTIATVKEYILMFSRTASRRMGKLPLSEKAKKEYRYSDSIGYFRRAILLDKTRGHHFYEVITPSGKILNGPWMKPEETFRKMEVNDEIYWTSGGMEQPYGKIYLHTSQGQIPSDFWGTEVGTNQRASKDLENIFGNRAFDFSKPISLIETLVAIGSNKRDAIVLDFFAGSGTTAHAVSTLNAKDGGSRQCILITHGDENGKNIAEDVTAARVKRVLSGKNWADGKEHLQLPGELTYYKLMFAQKTLNPLSAMELMQSKFVGLAALEQDVVLKSSTSDWAILSSSTKLVVVATNYEFLEDEPDEFIGLLNQLKKEAAASLKEFIAYIPSAYEGDEYSVQVTTGWTVVSFPLRYLEAHASLIERMKNNKTLLQPLAGDAATEEVN